MTARAPWPHGDPQTVVHAILRDPRFTGITSANPPEPTLAERILHWIGQQLARIFGAIGHVLGASSAVNVVIGTVVIVLAAGAAAYVVYRLALAYVRRRSARAPGAAVRALPAQRSSAELRAAALDAAAAGRYREAASLLLLASVRALDEAGRVRYDAARTPGEYRRLVRDPAFDALATAAVAAVFASGEPGAGDFARVRASYDAFVPARAD